MPDRYRTIVADPPWPDVSRRIGKGGRRANATELAYSLMPLGEIKALEVPAALHAHLYLWSTRHQFREGVAAAVARAWGFEPCGEAIWGLRNPGTGSAPFLNDFEPVLVARRGSLPFYGEDAMGVYFWRQVYEYGPAGVPQKVHSAKPPSFLNLVEQNSPGPYLEMFSRESRGRLGWSYWGDESLGTAEMPAA